MLEIKNIEKLQKIKLNSNALASLAVNAEIYNASDMHDSYWIEIYNKLDNGFESDTIILNKDADKYGKYQIKLLSGPNKLIDDMGIPLSEIKSFDRFAGIIEAIAILKWHKP